MNITDDLLTINEWSRPGKAIKEVRAIIMHWTGNPMSSAKQNRDFFDSRKDGKNGYGSAQYIIGIQGEVIRCIPDTEIAYHCGSSQTDPASKKIYTDWARSVFGAYASENSSPNNVSIGIEMCTLDNAGNFSDATIQSAASLVASLCKKYSVPVERIGTHNMVVGWKDCPRLWVNKPILFSDFKKAVSKEL